MLRWGLWEEPFFWHYRTVTKHSEAALADETQAEKSPGLEPAFPENFADPKARLAHAMRLLFAERMPEAAAQLRAVLAVEPECGDAVLALGVACVAMDRLGQAEMLFNRAAQLQSDPSAALSNRSIVLQKLGRSADALEAIEAVIARTPDAVHLWQRKADILRDCRRFKEAEAALLKVLELTGSAPLPIVAGDAEGLPAGALAVQSDLARTAILANLAREDKALHAVDRLLEEAPGDRALRQRRLECLVRLGRHEAALDLAEQMLADGEGDGGLLAVKTMCLVHLQRFEEALAPSARAIALMGNVPNAIIPRLLVLSALHREEEALPLADRLLLQSFDEPSAYNNRGYMHLRLGDPARALRDFERAARFRQLRSGSAFNIAFARLQMGDYSGGWEAYEGRWAMLDDVLPEERFEMPLWDGREEIAGRSILVWWEQGVGDVIQFVRYVKELSDRGARVVLVVQKALTRLLGGIAGADVVANAYVPGMPEMRVDLHCPLLGLPHRLGTTLETIPPPVAPPVDAAVREKWRARLGPKRGLRVGIVWSGNPKFGGDRDRSMPLARFLAALPEGVEFVSLQKEVRERDRELLAAQSGILDLSGEIGDFVDTAALILECDLVVSTCTSVPHLSATLGVPTFILVQFSPDFRWMLDRVDSPWYPAVRLFRQHRRGDWTEALAETRAAIAAMAAREG